MMCQKCGTQNPEGTRFCSGCGAPLGDAAPQPQIQGRASQPMGRRPGNGRTVAIAALAVLLAAAVVALALLVVLPRLSGGQQGASDQPALEQPEQTDDGEGGATSGPEATPTQDTTSDPDATAPSDGVTLEDALRSSGEYDATCEQLASSLEQSEGVADVQIEVTGNTIYVGMRMDMTSDDPDAAQMAQTMMNLLESDDVVSQMSQACSQFESNTGISGVSYTYDLYTSDGVNFGFVTYDASGIVASEGVA